MALTPDDPFYANMLHCRPSSHRPIKMHRKEDVFEYATGQSFKNLMRSMISSESAAEAVRQSLSRNPYFDARSAFSMVDHNATGLVSKDDIRYLMESRGHYISDRDACQVTK